jgi:hypothetical protein
LQFSPAASAVSSTAYQRVDTNTAEFAVYQFGTQVSIKATYYQPQYQSVLTTVTYPNGTQNVFHTNSFNITITGDVTVEFVFAASGPAPTPHPSFCNLTVNWADSGFIVEVNRAGFPNHYSASFPWGTTVTISAIYSGNGNHEFYGWETVDSTGTFFTNSTSALTVTMDRDKAVEPKLRDTTAAPTSIPGFPVESIIIGLLLAFGLLYIAKRKASANLPAPR